MRHSSVIQITTVTRSRWGYAASFEGPVVAGSAGRRPLTAQLGVAAAEGPLELEELVGMGEALTLEHQPKRLRGPAGSQQRFGAVLEQARRTTRQIECLCVGRVQLADPLQHLEQIIVTSREEGGDLIG